MVEILTAQAQKKGAVMHCDEIWYRLILYKVKKVYIWCLVNEAEKIVIFFYDNGKTCKKQGYSAQEYFEEFFTQIIKGRRDYENLISATICIKKQLKNQDILFTPGFERPCKHGPFKRG